MCLNQKLKYLFLGRIHEIIASIDKSKRDHKNTHTLLLKFIQTKKEKLAKKTHRFNNFHIILEYQSLRYININ